MKKNNKKRKRRHNTIKSRKKSKTRRKEKYRKPLYVVGMISVPLTPDKKYFSVCGDSYIASSHIRWLQRHNIKVVPIPYTTKDYKYYMKRINGLYFPSGGAFAGTQHEYYHCCKTFLKLAMKENDTGHYFPIWGGCMGMQQMMIIADEHDDLKNLLTRFDSYDNLLLNLEFTPEGKRSRLVRFMKAKVLKKLEKRPCTLNNHKLGISPLRFKRHKNLDNFYKVVSWSRDRKGRKFVSTIEGRYYPFFGVQWHPERSSEMDYFVKFFKSELRKNKKKLRKTRRKLFKKEIDCFNYSDSLYKKCRFYWHKKTSKHNRKLCNAAQLLKNNPEDERNGV